ncbi:hypothetical protein BCR43DRAFT_19496 [Syncephalastrum racemosum]|uniref:Alpha/beta hydrolase fold-3 domain-containing protein n=1 Tax=Syncephalastrum racemosum TaxID=13706 RepID=A0A1X2HSY7_SYNRA|nr:hypothetical protein BCR43DRAFT_19496 [Syncephalastrum racemosum]
MIRVHVPRFRPTWLTYYLWQSCADWRRRLRAKFFSIPSQTMTLKRRPISNSTPTKRTAKSIYAPHTLNATVADLRGMPRTILITVEVDIWRDEAEAYARKLTTAGNDIVATRYWGTTHSTFRGPRWSPSADTIIEQTHQWLKKCV